MQANIQKQKWCNEKIALPLNMTMIHQQEERLQAQTLNKMYLLFLKDFKIIAFQQWQMSIGGYRYSNDQGDEGGSLLMWSPDYTVGRLSERHLQFESTSEESWFFAARHSWYNRALWVTSRTTCSLQGLPSCLSRFLCCYAMKDYDSNINKDRKPINMVLQSPYV